MPNNIVQNAIFALRKGPVYLRLIWFGRIHFLPFLFFLSVVWFALTFGSHLLFNIANSMGAFCHGNEATATPVNLGTDQQSSVEFHTSQLCASTGLKVKNGYEYAITIEIIKPWDDGGEPADPRGYRTSQVRRLLQPAFYLGVPLRRIIFRSWFRMIARVGERGVDEYFFLDPVKGNGITPNTYTAKFTADRSGEVFLYVNDAVIGLPWVHSLFYINNHGTARISIRLL